MPLTLLCERCKQPIEVDDETIKAAAEMKVPLSVSHEEGKCPVDVQSDKPLRHFKVKIEVFEMVPNTNVTWDLLASFGGEYRGTSFAEAMPGLQRELNKGWEQVQQMSAVIDGD